MNKYDKEFNTVVDLDIVENRPGRSAKNAFRLVVRLTRTVNLAVINAWLTKQIDLNESVLEAFSKFLTLDAPGLTLANCNRFSGPSAAGVPEHPVPFTQAHLFQ